MLAPTPLSWRNQSPPSLLIIVAGAAITSGAASNSGHHHAYMSATLNQLTLSIKKRHFCLTSITAAAPETLPPAPSLLVARFTTAIAGATFISGYHPCKTLENSVPNPTTFMAVVGGWLPTCSSQPSDLSSRPPVATAAAPFSGEPSTPLSLYTLERSRAASFSSSSSSLGRRKNLAK